VVAGNVRFLHTRLFYYDVFYFHLIFALQKELNKNIN